MALPALSLAQALKLRGPAQFEYFTEYARYMGDSPRKPYCIRVGSKTLFSDDTHDLRQQFDRYLANERRRATLTGKRKPARRPS